MTRKYRRIFAATLVASGLAAAPVIAHNSAEEAAIGADHAAAHDYQPQAAKNAAAASALSGAAILRTAVSGPPSAVGQWADPVPLPDGVIGIHAVMMPTGKVIWWGTKLNPSSRHNSSPPPGDHPSARADGPNGASAAVWDPAGGAAGFTRIDPPANIWCSGQSLLSDGSVLITGGNYAYSQPDDPNTPENEAHNYEGEDVVLTFDPFTQTWNNKHPRMADGRWYPTQVLLDDGTTIITSGFNKSGLPLAQPPNPDGRNLDIERFTPGPTRSSAGTVTKIGVRTADKNGLLPNQPPNGGLYPHHFLMPSGNVLTAGPFFEDTWRLTSPKTSTAWADVLPISVERTWGTGVLMPRSTPGSTQVMLIGGNDQFPDSQTDQAVATTELYDEANPGAGWQPRPSMSVGRGHANTVLLPDGSMVEVGGGVGIAGGDQWAVSASGDERQVELWNPATGQWTLGPAQSEARAYHSTALLLPDGRVVSAGDDVHDSRNTGALKDDVGIRKDTYEVYSPPYLFKGARPSINFAPAEVRYGAPLHIGSPDVNVTRAVLMAPGATTHANDMNQRYVPVTLTKRGDGRGYDLVAPSGPTIAPPGYYMLFLINANGVPSVAKFIRLHPNAADAPDIPAPPNPPGNLPGSKIGSRVALGSFESPRLAPWVRKNAAARVRGGSSGKYSVRLTGLRRKPAMLTRRLPTVAPGRYVLVFSVRDGRATRVTRTSKLNEVRLAAGRRGWRKVTLNIQVNAGTPPAVRFRMDPRRTTRVDNAYLIRVS